LVSEIKPQEYFEIWEMNLQALQVFCACGDDWKLTPQGKDKSIDKLALGAVMEMMEVANKKQMLTDIIIMQNAALEVLSNG